MPRHRHHSRQSRLEALLLNAGAVLGSLCFVMALLAVIFGVKPLIFSSGSMGPAIPAGSLALSIPVAADEVSPGQVVSIVMNDGIRLTHRVVSVNADSSLVLKGDANPVADIQPYTGASVNLVFFSAPGLGYVASWLTSLWMWVAGGLLCAYLLYVAFFRRDDNGEDSAGGGEKAEPGTRRRAWIGIGAMVTVIAIALPVGGAARLESTQAAFSAAAVASSPVTAAVMIPPVNSGCAKVPGNNKAVKFSWQTPASNSSMPLKGYQVSVQRNNGATPPTMIGTVSTASYPPGTTEITMDGSQSGGILGTLLANLLTLLAGFSYTYSVTVTAEYGLSLENHSTWSSQPYVNHLVSVSAGALGTNLQVSCP